MVTIIIGVSRVIDYKTAEMSVDIPPFPEWNSGHYIEIPGEGIVFSGEKNDDGSRCHSGVIESHYDTDDWALILTKYKNWLKDKERKFSYLFVLRNGELVHHEINKSELI
ncbi:hypothetical protein EAMG_05270 [Escherichia coli M056]|uniref:hypothetical protein n=1 Tax=Escherichia coli TaxID=562 RepID=UPI000A18529E|nr:hypothetical protein [Escherichia coli]OSK15952.1 hypothetical protein EAMG_05270 [Escherichia coli M056]